MIIKILEEAGFDWALCGASLSYKSENVSLTDWWTEQKKSNMHNVCTKMATQDGGHNKFLESIQVWIFIKAPRGWWQEFDTYRVGTTKNSASTMHTIQKSPVTMDNFEPGTDERIVNTFNDILAEVTDNFNNTKRLKEKDLERVKWNLPEGYLQSRIVNTNYKVLRHILLQRFNHWLPQWQLFRKEILNQCEHREMLPS